MNVWYGSNENRWLSNLAYRPFFYGRQHYVTVEQAYQSWKSGKFDERTYGKRWAAGVKLAGNMGTNTREGWNIDLMGHLMYLSFKANPEQAEMLIQIHASGIEFTHNQDNGIWKTVFPNLLHTVGDQLAKEKYDNN
tara:strand:+ start:366 stop:773 length:408 start_codon:yes stop_codon:yes gene_type:complete